MVVNRRQKLFGKKLDSYRLEVDDSPLLSRERPQLERWSISGGMIGQLKSESLVRPESRSSGPPYFTY